MRNFSSLLYLALGVGAAAKRLQDPWGHFCGKENCYELLGVKRGEEKLEIRRAYRALSKEHHPDKNLGRKTEAKFSKIAKAYEVLIDDGKRKKYDHCLDHPDAYWEEYGHHWVLEYAPESDVRMVLLGLLLFLSLFQPFVQYGRYQNAVKAIAKAADEGLGPKNGGNATTVALRKRAEEVLAEREKQAAVAVAAASKKGANGTQAGNGTPSSSSGGRKEVKKTRQEKALEQRKALSAIIYELSLEVDIQGPHCKPKLRDVPVFWVALLPWRLGERLWRSGRFYWLRWKGLPSPMTDREYWARAALGRDTWETLEPEQRQEALEGAAWEGGKALEEWKMEHLTPASLPTGARRRRRGRGSAAAEDLDQDDAKME